MVFSNLVFLFVFLPIVIVSYYLIRKEFKNILLLVSSLFFYAWGEPRYIILMIISIIINYFMGLIVNYRFKHRNYNKLILAAAIILNLLILSYYKYADFILSNLNGLFGLEYELKAIALPIGISFYTFQAISYLLDIYRNESKPQKNIIDLALYISFFPQLVAGPIVRYESIAQQLKLRYENVGLFSQGVRQFIIGLAKKILIANQVGLVADEIFSTNTSQLSPSLAWVGIIAYTLQIFFDFSGYSDMAIGLGKMFGFNLPMNFNYPYISRSVTEFWRRWHITLGGWFRDYVYIPLGGNRTSTWKYIRNIIIVWFLTGLWHGASWNFVAWGLYFGAIIALEKFGFGKLLSRLWRPIQHIYLIIIVVTGWVFFRSESFTQSFTYIKTMFGVSKVGFFELQSLYYIHDYWLYFVIGILFSMPIGQMLTTAIKGRISESAYSLVEIVQTVLVLGLFYVSVFYLTSSTFNPFIYFRF